MILRNGIGFRGYGNVVINHKNELWTLCAHCNSFKVKRWQTVKQGQQVASVERTAPTAAANRLHFEIRNSKGVALDSLKYLPKERVFPFSLYRKK